MAPTDILECLISVRKPDRKHDRSLNNSFLQLPIISKVGVVIFHSREPDNTAKALSRQNNKLKKN